MILQDTGEKKKTSKNSEVSFEIERSRYINQQGFLLSLLIHIFLFKEIL